MLTLEDIQVWRDDRAILELKRLHLNGQQFTAILGHNGSGKSTLMKLLARQIVPDRGAIMLDGQPIERYSQRWLARKLAYLPQQLPAVAGLSVRELVRLGRFPWRGLLGRWQADDAAIVEEALSRTDTLRYADRLAEHLSGGGAPARLDRHAAGSAVAAIAAGRTDVGAGSRPSVRRNAPAA